MQVSYPTSRFEGASTVEVEGVEVPVAAGLGARLLGLAGLGRERAGPGLLIPGCSSAAAVLLALAAILQLAGFIAIRRLSRVAE